MTDTMAGEALRTFGPEVKDVQSRYIIVHQLRASADIQSAEITEQMGMRATTDRASLMRKAADLIEALDAQPSASLTHTTAGEFEAMLETAYEDHQKGAAAPGDSLFSFMAKRLRAHLAAQPSAGAQGYGWNEDMTRLPAALTLIFRDPVDADGCEMVRFGLSTDAMNATAWSYLPGVIATPAQPDTSMQSKMVARLEAVANLIQRPPLDDVLIDQSTALTLAADIRAIIANQPDTGVALSASDRACYDYPGVDQGPLRDAFVAGAEAYAQPDTGDVAALREALGNRLNLEGDDPYPVSAYSDDIILTRIVPEADLHAFYAALSTANTQGGVK